ncbi:PSAT, partial [Symbiodinium pilosum]
MAPKDGTRRPRPGMKDNGDGYGIFEWKQYRHSKGTFDDAQAAGVRLTVVPGIAGVNYLDPDSYVFAPVVRILESLGYVEGFAPSMMEKRDGYFQKLVSSIETLDRSGTGVILLAHSMGNKVISYFLDFVVKKKGQAWVDKHIHLWLAAGAPHLGAPQAVRSTVFGDNFGLDAFITGSEARAFARSLSASPWLFPAGEMAKQPMFHLRKGGALEVCSITATVPNSGIVSAENKVMVSFEVSWGDGTSGAGNLTTKSASTFDGSKATFDEKDNFLQFGGPTQLPASATIRAILKEKGYHDTSTDMLSRFGQAVKAGVMLVEEAAAGRRGLGVPRAQTEAKSLAE